MGRYLVLGTVTDGDGRSRISDNYRSNFGELLEISTVRQTEQGRQFVYKRIMNFYGPTGPWSSGTVSPRTLSPLGHSQEFEHSVRDLKRKPGIG